MMDGSTRLPRAVSSRLATNALAPLPQDPLNTARLPLTPCYLPVMENSRLPIELCELVIDSVLERRTWRDGYGTYGVRVASSATHQRS